MRRQWVIVLQDVPETGMHWDGPIPADAMQDPSLGEVAPLASMRSDLDWKGDLARKGDVYRLHGHWHFRVERQCSRCNEPFELEMDGDTDCDFRLGTGVRDEDASLLLPPPGEVNLVDVLREDVWLAWPQDVVCREDCLGLCPVCGCNRNQGGCQCHQMDKGHPFAALGKIKFD
ncbi:MAG TPA: DUF177 domain-containing protein [Mariprofundaceae bacterium]|nr:DUF177 domain-containing protein [Mariprofundaceae bacterium]